MSRGVNGQNIFVDDRDRESFLDRLENTRSNASADILAYCLMGNHFHIAIKVGTVPLSEIMQRLETSYCLLFNHRHERTGHLFQARYTAKICLNEAYLRTVVQYIVMNPVRAGLVSKPEDWPWSSLAGKPLTEAVQHDLENFDPWANDLVKDMDLHRRDYIPQRTLNEIGEFISAQTAVELAVLRSDERRRTVVCAKSMLVQAALKEGHKPTDIARWLHSANSSVSRYARSNTGIWKA